MIDGKQTSGVSTITLNQASKSLKIYCDMSTPGEAWIIIQRRIDSLDFNRNWEDYKTGFGNLTGSMWIGLDNLHLLTGSGRKAILRIDIRHMNDLLNIYTAKYSTFRVENANQNYRLVIGGYSGNAGDSLGSDNGAMFSAKNKDNAGLSGKNCAQICKGGWWYKSCVPNLNSEFPSKDRSAVNSMEDMSWTALYNTPGNVVFSEMKIKFED